MYLENQTEAAAVAWSDQKMCDSPSGETTMTGASGNRFGAVAAFLAGQIGFTRIAAHVEDVLCGYAPPAPACLDDVIAVDAEARIRARALMEFV